MATQTRLTQLVKAGGCASKLAPGTLQAVLRTLPAQVNANVMVGFDTSDDAGVYRLNDDLALVQTVDFFTPLVDGPFTFGQIAATNALSDVYAMGGKPLSALALVCFPPQEDPEVLGEIMRGGLSKMEEAGCAVIGGHSVRDAEIKFGYAVTGSIHPQRVYTNAGARPGDALVLTKPIGTGAITTAHKQGKAKPEWVDGAVRWMTTLNRDAAEVVASGFEVHAMTDVTGFGLMGHAREVALGAGVRLEIHVDAVPLLPGALEAIAEGGVSAGLLANREFAECLTRDAPDAEIHDAVRTLLFDPQTAGGLLICVAEQDATDLVGALQGRGLPAALIGRVVEPYVQGSGKPVIELR